MIRTLLASGALALGLSTAAFGATTIFEDNFNSDAIGVPTSSLNNWDVISGTVDVIGPGAFDFYPGNGNYLDLNGTPGAAAIKTSDPLGLVIGKSYELSFDYGNNAGSNGIEELTFGLGTNVLSFAITGAVASLTNYVVSFIYDGSGDYLFFADTGTASPNDNGGPILDNVKLSAVPLPAAGLMLLAGLGALGALRRRKGAAAAV